MDMSRERKCNSEVLLLSQEKILQVQRQKLGRWRPYKHFLFFTDLHDCWCV